ncbi:hypothetical protein [Brassicibacter mesophilus]|uniref:hypothetical protein n=1 Tax=Brassicibacter mesophilus TaxID=745119 RepID=UPI003D1D8E6B
MGEYALKFSYNNHKVIEIMYMKGIEITQRKIQVLKIEDESIKALDIDKGAIRTFKKDNILAAINISSNDTRKNHNLRRI